MRKESRPHRILCKSLLITRVITFLLVSDTSNIINEEVNALKYCNHCGKELLDDAIICPSCGCGVQFNGQFNGAPNYNNGNYQQQNAQYGNPQNNYGQYQYSQHQRQQTPPYADKYSPLSIAGFVLSFFGSFVIVALILSIVAYNEAKNTGSLKSKSLSKAGIIISSIVLGLAVVVFVIFYIMIIGVGLGSALLWL